MPNLELEYLRLRRELVMKYGNQPVTSPANKALALILLTRSFKRVPDESSFQAELDLLAQPFENMSKPEVKKQLNDLQDSFRRNRFIEIIVENPENPLIHDPRHVTLDAKIAAAEALGVTSSDAFSMPLATGQTLGELIGDLYQLYLVEYRAFRKNRTHPIFCLVEGDATETEQAPQAIGRVRSRKKGCVGLALAMLMVVYHFFSICIL